MPFQADIAAKARPPDLSQRSNDVVTLRYNDYTGQERTIQYRNRQL
jgi:hypothetical protein